MQEQPNVQISRSSRPRTDAGRPEVLVREIDGELVILDRGRGVVHQLNGTATLVWKHCDGARTVSDIAEALSRAYDVSVDIAERDVAATVRQLAELHLLADTEGSRDAVPQGEHHG